MKKTIILLTILFSTIFSNVAFADIMLPHSEECAFSVKNKSFDKEKCLDWCELAWVKRMCTRDCQRSETKCLLKNKDLYQIYILGFVLFFIFIFWVIKFYEKKWIKKTIYLVSGIIISTFLFITSVNLNFWFLILLFVIVFIKIIFTFLFRWNKKLELDKIENKNILIKSSIIYSISFFLIILIWERIAVWITWWYELTNSFYYLWFLSILMILLESFLFNKLLGLKYKKSIEFSLIINWILIILFTILWFILRSI